MKFEYWIFQSENKVKAAILENEGWRVIFSVINVQVEQIKQVREAVKKMIKIFDDACIEKKSIIEGPAYCEADWSIGEDVVKAYEESVRDALINQ